MVNISSIFPKDDRHLNGLERIAQALIDKPFDEHVIVARVQRRRVTIDDQTGKTTPTVRLVHVEAVIDAGRRDDAVKILEAEYGERTGRKDLPPHDLMNQPDEQQHAGQSTVGRQLAEQSAPDRDPAAGPHPGDSDAVEVPDGRPWPGDPG